MQKYLIYNISENDTALDYTSVYCKVYLSNFSNLLFYE